jgi:hypothetical protein
VLLPQQIQQFIADGFVRIDGAFPRELAEQGREFLWRDTGCDPNDRSTWTKPVIRLGDYPQEPFRRAVNMPCLLEAFDQLVGVGRWQPRASLGGFPIRFPSPEDPGDTGWHADASFPPASGEGPWRINVFSRGRALLMLFLFSDVGEDDAPTRIRVGSHLDVPKLLEPFGEEGISFFELGGMLDATAHRQVVLATGTAGTVFLCHPFLIHAAQAHRGSTAKFMAQPPLYPGEEVRIHREDGAYSPVEIAIRMGLGLTDLL